MKGRTSNRRKEIVELARSRFTSNGYEGTSIGELASQLGISKAAIAYYFPTKDTFLEEFVGPFLDQLESRVESAESGEDALSSYLRTLIEYQDVAVWMDTDPALQTHETHGGRLARINERLIDRVAVGESDVDRVAAVSAMGGIWRPVREFSSDELEEHFDEVLAVALAGVG